MTNVAAQTSKRKAYPAYKPSGIEWVGKIPEHWDTLKLKYIAKASFSNVDKHTVEGEAPVRLCNYVDVYYNDCIRDDLDLMKATATSAEIAKFTLRSDDVIITKDSEAWDDIAIPAYVPEDMLGVLCGYHLSQVRPDCQRTDGEYLFRAFCSCGINDQFRVASTGITRFGLGKYGLDNALFVVPPKHEQRDIAAFLDRETARIDALIQKKQRQIELLQEKRAAFISHAVTKGLNPDVKMKPSGVEWLGEIPNHWEIRRLKYLIEGTLSNGLFKKKEFFGSGTKLVNVFDVYREDFLVDHEGLERVEADEVERQKYAVKSGDIFFVRSSLKLEGVGRSVCAMNVPETTVFECHVVRARPAQKTITPTFLIHFLNSIPAINRFISLANLVTMATIDQDKIKSLEATLPPRDEQDQIMTILNRDGARTEKLERKIVNSIERLREYRIALLSAAVTGKIDVRQEVA